MAYELICIVDQVLSVIKAVEEWRDFGDSEYALILTASKWGSVQRLASALSRSWMRGCSTSPVTTMSWSCFCPQHSKLEWESSPTSPPRPHPVGYVTRHLLADQLPPSRQLQGVSTACLIFLEEVPSQCVQFMAPGVYHHTHFTASRYGCPEHKSSPWLMKSEGRKRWLFSPWPSSTCKLGSVVPFWQRLLVETWSFRRFWFNMMRST